MSAKTKTKNVAEEQKKESKKFNVTYAVTATIAFVVVAAILITTYYTSNYVMFSPEKVARQYVMNTVDYDGYDALKYSVMSVSDKMGNYLRENYMKQYVEAHKDEEAPKLTADEAGEKLTEILDTMYPSFVKLVNEYGFEKYDELFTQYFKEYALVHNAVYGNDIMSYDDMFAAIEGNLATYMDTFKYQRETLYGKGEEYAHTYIGADKTITEDELKDNPYSAGFYIDTEASVVKEYSDSEVKSYVDSLSPDAVAAYKKFGIDTSKIKAVTTVKVTNTLTGEGDKDAIDTVNKIFEATPSTLTLVKIGSQWYVDITA